MHHNRSDVSLDLSEDELSSIDRASCTKDESIDALVTVFGDIALDTSARQQPATSSPKAVKQNKRERFE